MTQNKVKKACNYCTTQAAVDFKDTESLKNFLNAYKSIAPRRRTGACAWHQRKVTRAIKQARVMGLLPFINREV